jgi:hypothetical protein
MALKNSLNQGVQKARDAASQYSEKIDQHVKRAKDTAGQYKEEFQKYAGQAKEDMQEAENLEIDAEQREEEARKEAKEAVAETEDAEETGNQAEAKDAEKKEKDAEDKAGNAERDVDQAGEDLVGEIKIEEKQEKMVKNIQEEAKGLFREARKSLQEEFTRLQTVKQSENAQLTKTDYQNVEAILEEFQEATSLVNESTWMLSNLMDEILETEKEENQLEKLSSTLANEFEFMEKEVGELEKVFTQLKDQKHEQMAEKERAELEKEEQHEQQEIQEEQRIDAEIQSEAKNSEELIKEDEELLQVIDKSIGDLRSLYKLLKSEKSIWNMVLNSNPPLGDVEETINLMQDALNSDEESLKNVEKEESKIRDNIPSGPRTPSRSGFFNAARTGITGSKILLLVPGIFVVLILLYIYGP